MRKIYKAIKMRPNELFFQLYRRSKIIQEQLGLQPDYKINQESVSMRSLPLLGFEKDEERNKEYFYSTFPKEAKRLIQKAEMILEHRFDLLGYNNLSFGEEIDWSFEPVRNKKNPAAHWSKVSPFNSEDVGDLKIVWELNRHQHLIPIGQAYFLTGDDRFAVEIVRQICDWREKNPPGIGTNWASSLEVAFRLISWIWAIRLIKKSKALNKEFKESLAVLVGEHARHIEKYLSTYYSPNTHLTGEALGLFYAGAFFPRLPEASRWNKKGKDILFKMLPLHLLQDGGYVERTLWYHQYTINFYLHFFIILINLGEVIPQWAWERLEQGISFLMYSLKPDKTIPMIGDDDGGFFLPLSTAPFYAAGGALAVSASLFQKGEFKALAGKSHPETIWLLGIEGECIYQNLVGQLPKETTKGFKETGYFFLRSGWNLNSNYMAFDCGPHGWLNGGHAHADLLSFNVVSGQNSIIEDTGTYLYINENEKEWRNLFRGPKNHATLWIEGKHPAVPSEIFHWNKIPEHKLYRFYTRLSHDYIAGGMITDEGLEHIREIHFLKPNYFLVIDSIKGKGKRNIEVRFPLSSGKWSLSEIGCWQEEKENSCGIIPLGYNEMEAYLEPSWVSPLYGKKEAANILVLKGERVLPYRMACLIDLSGEKPLDRPSFIMGNNIFKLTFKEESWFGFGMAKPKELINEDEIKTDYKAGLLKYSSHGGIKVLAIHDGSYLYFQGKEIKKAE